MENGLSNASAQVEELRGIADALRRLPREQANDVYLENMASRYLGKALKIGAFAHPKWIRFRTDAEHWYRHDLPFVSACDWFKDNGPNLGLQIETEKENGDLEYWAPFVANLIDVDAAAIEARDNAARAEAARAPKNRWNAIHHWWQHNLYATIVVVVVGVVSAIGGLIAFARELLALFGKGS